MSGSTVCFYNGVRLWKNAMTLRANPRSGAPSTKIGLGKKKGRVYPRSPNNFYEIMVSTSVPPVTAISTAVGRQATHHLYMLQTQKRLVDQSRSYGYLSWVVDEEYVLTVSGGPYAGANQVVSYTGSGFVPASGQYVLVRNASTGDGFVTQVEGTGVNTLTIDCQNRNLDRALASVSVTAGWKIYLVAYHYPYTMFLNMAWGEAESQGEDKHSMNVQYVFESESDVVNASAYDLDLT